MTWFKLQSDRTSAIADRPSASSNISPFGHQIRVFEPAIGQISSFVASNTIGPTHPVPTFVPFGTMVWSANAGEDESANAAARSKRRMNVFLDQTFRMIHRRAANSTMRKRGRTNGRTFRGAAVYCVPGDLAMLPAPADGDPKESSEALREAVRDEPALPFNEATQVRVGETISESRMRAPQRRLSSKRR